MNSRRISWPIGARFKNVVHDFGKPGIFLNSRQGYASSGVYNKNGVLKSLFEFLIGFRTLFEFWIGFGTLWTDTQNLIWGPHSVPTYTPYTTELVVAGLKQYWTTRAVRFVNAFRSDTGGLASLGRRSGSARSAFDSDVTGRTDTQN